MAFVANASHAAPGPPKPWATMKKPERKKYMEDVVLPKMKVLLREFYDQRFGVVKCVTCHGAGVKNETYKMPNPKLPQLPTDDAGWADLRKHQGDIVRFMETKVKPTMAALIGEQPSGPGVKHGFDCTECHTRKKKK